jgi:branched-chain amino acid transport system substrate-binding protein
MTPKAWRSIVGSVLLSTLVVSACSSSSKSGSGTSPTSSSATTVDLSVLGPPKAAAGAPLKIGYIYAGQAENQDNTPEINMAQATVKYVNEHLGGVAGRPLQLVVCTDHLTPAGSTDCANQMLAAKVPVVLAGEPASGSSITTVLEPAKVPFVINTGADASLLSADVTTLVNPTVIFAVPVKIAKDNNVKKVAVINVDVPAAAQAKIIADPLLKKAGLQTVWTAVPLGTPDVTPQVQAAISSGAQEFVIIGDTSLCVTSLKALKTLGFAGKVISNVNCLTDKSASTIPGGFDGLIVPSTRVFDQSEPDYKLEQAIAAQYAPGTPTDDTGQASLGFADIMMFQRAMKDLTSANATPSGIAQQFIAMTPAPQPLLSASNFHCNRQASSLLKSVCSNNAAIETIDKSGSIKSVVPFDATPYL